MVDHQMGMTVEQAKSVLGNDARLIDLEADEAELKALWTKYNLPKDIERHFVEALRVEGVQVGSLMMEASVMVRPEDKTRICRVMLRLNKQTDIGQDQRELAFRDLRRMLTEKYGTPEDQQTSRREIDDEFFVMWRFPSTSITLQYSESRSYILRPSGTVTVEYLEAKKADKL